MNKTIASISAAVIIGGSSVSAFVPAAADLGVTSDLTFASEYVFRGIELADNSFQPSIEASVGDFYVGLWSNLPLKAGQQSEINYYGGFALDIPGVEFMTLDVGATVYHLPRANQNRNHELFVGTKFDSFGVAGVSAAAYYFYDVDIRTHVLEGSLGYSFDLNDMANMPASIDLSVLYGNQSGSSLRRNGLRRNAENYHYYGASAELPWQVNQFSTVTAGAHYQTAERITGAGRGQNLFWTLSYTAGF